MARVSRMRRLRRRLAVIALVLLVADVAYLTTLWPDWKRLSKGATPRSNFMMLYDQERKGAKWPRIAWHPVALGSLPPHLVRAVLLAEDIRFYGHSGFDLIAIRDAWEYNITRGRLAMGASTISQQTAKNLFLSPARTPLRKWHELILTIGLEQNLSKRRILEIYLNTAEFGRGIYGVEAAARAYWDIPAAKLSVSQAAELAATLPGPVKHNPATRTRYFVRHSRQILALLAREFAVESGEPLPDSPPQLERELPDDDAPASTPI